MQDYALFLLDPDGRIAAWYAGAERIFGYKSNEIVGENVAATPGGRAGTGQHRDDLVP